MRLKIAHVFLFGVMLLPGAARGQNVSNYGAIPDPFLFFAGAGDS
jgi:hypothetical protein